MDIAIIISTSNSLIRVFVHVFKIINFKYLKIVFFFNSKNIFLTSKPYSKVTLSPSIDQKLYPVAIESFSNHKEI